MGQRDLFRPDGMPPMQDADIVLHHGFMYPKTAIGLMEHLIERVNWRQDRITAFGKPRLVPRLHQWYANEGCVYSWSGISMSATPWTDEILRIRDAVSKKAGVDFNSVLINYYRDGSDMVSWHSDDEEELGDEPVIASLSLGAVRDFKLRHKRVEYPVVTIELPHGSLLVMKGPTQKFWQHSIPRRKGVTTPRVNLTFRVIEEKI